MNIVTVSTGISAHSPNKFGSVFAGNLSVLHNSALKSVQDRAERQQKASNEIAFWEKQKENLKNRECDTVEEIAQKLHAFHSYEEEIAAVKSAYNNEQLSHILDEAQEQGEKNAEAAKKLEPKTPEERREEMVEEALGTEEDSILDEMLDEVAEAAEDLLEEQEEMLEKTQEELLEKAREDLLDGAQEDLLEESQEKALEEAVQAAQEAAAQKAHGQKAEGAAQEQALEAKEQAIEENVQKIQEKVLERTAQYEKLREAVGEKYRKGLDYKV